MEAFVHQKMHSVKIKYTLHIDFVRGKELQPQHNEPFEYFQNKIPTYFLLV